MQSCRSLCVIIVLTALYTEVVHSPLLHSPPPQSLTECGRCSGVQRDSSNSHGSLGSVLPQKTRLTWQLSASHCIGISVGSGYILIIEALQNGVIALLPIRGIS